MTQEEFEIVFRLVYETSKKMLLSKSKEYAGDGDRLHNFHIAAAMNGCTTEAALWGLLTKHIVSLRDLCLGVTEGNESMWREKIMDTINYLILLAGAVDAFKEED